MCKDPSVSAAHCQLPLSFCHGKFRPLFRRKRYHLGLFVGLVSVIYLDTEAKEQVYAQAQDIVNKLEELDAYLREHGNVMRAVSRSGYLTTNGIISIGNNNEFSINLPGFRYVEKFTRR